MIVISLHIYSGKKTGELVKFSTANQSPQYTARAWVTDQFLTCIAFRIKNVQA